MKNIFIVALVASLLTLFSLKTAHADEVILKDGSRVMGKVVSMKSEKLEFETSFAGKSQLNGRMSLD